MSAHPRGCALIADHVWNARPAMREDRALTLPANAPGCICAQRAAPASAGDGAGGPGGSQKYQGKPDQSGSRFSRN